MLGLSIYTVVHALMQVRDARHSVELMQVAHGNGPLLADNL